MYSLEHLLYPWTAYRFIVMSLILTSPMHVHLCMHLHVQSVDVRQSLSYRKCHQYHNFQQP